MYMAFISVNILCPIETKVRLLKVLQDLLQAFFINHYVMIVKYHLSAISYEITEYNL